MTAPNILERVRKLLAQANDDGVTAQEAEAFASKAAELMARHGIEQALVDAHRDPADDPMTHQRIDLDRPYPHERGALLNNIGRAFSVKVYWGTHRATLVGRRSDIERTEQLYTALLLYVAAALVAPVDTSWCWDSKEAAATTRAYRKSWLAGFAARIGSRLRAIHREVVADSGEPGSALVLANRFDAATAHGKELFPAAGIHRERKISDTRGYMAGISAADHADVGQTSVGGQRRALGGAR